MEGQPIETLERLTSRRRSCRAFRPQPVARALIIRILEMAQKNASWCNSQPWRVIVTSGVETDRFRRAMYKAANGGGPQKGDFPFPHEYSGVYAERRRESGFQLYNASSRGVTNRPTRAKRSRTSISSERPTSPL